MIFFFADNHYGARPGFQQAQALASDFDFTFYEDDWSAMGTTDFSASDDLLLLNMVGDTCEIPHPDGTAESRIRAYAEGGGNFLLLHGSSAAFWQWDWWRESVGYRWVRPDDPDGAKPSTHPVRPCELQVSKCRHPLVGKLRSVALPEDEIYIELEQVGPVTTLMETTTEEGTFPQCFTHNTPWGGTIHSFIPGHRPEVVTHPDLLANIKVLLMDLLGE